jgi:hypothetical protein
LSYFLQSEKPASVARQVAFVVGGCCAAYGGLALVDTHDRVKLFQQSAFSSRGTWIFPDWSDIKTWFDAFGSFGSTRVGADREYHDRIRDIRSLPAPPIIKEYAEMIYTRWHAQSTNEKWTWCMILANIGVFAAWRVRSL